jgi:transcriptional regulator with XRE-family HTH domain
VSNHELADRLRAARDYVGLTIAETSTTSGIPEMTLAALELGRVDVDDVTLQRLAGTYGVRTSYFTEPEDQLLAGAVTVLGRLGGELEGHDRDEALRFAAYLRHANAG